MTGELDNKDGHGDDNDGASNGADNSDDHGGDDDADNDNDNYGMDIVSMDRSTKTNSLICFSKN